MKILAIRGKNLASLRQPFELDLTSPPLRDAGLFAITGPTGAGKTTLLDAMCLALFDEVPRYSGSHRFQNQEARDPGLSSTDPRNLLRHGAVEGLAEVDFLGLDRRRYRATWTVRRAHNKPDGQLQSQTMSLRCLDDDQRLGDTKTDVKRFIAEKLGLDYVQFCRSVLLAQGDFATFIRSDPKKRAEVLERITGTKLYSRLSIAAHQRHRDESQRLLELGTERSALSLLDDEAIAAITVEIEQLQALERERQQHLQRLEQAEAHLRQEQQLQQLLAEATFSRDQAQASLTTLLDQGIEAILGAQPLRPYVEARDRDRARLAELVTELPRLEQALLAAAAQRERADEDAIRAQHALDALESRIRELDPFITEAEALDLRITDRRSHLRTEDQTVASLAKKLAEARLQQEDLELSLAELATAEQRLNDWIADHAADALIADQWQLWQALLQELCELQPELALRAATAHAQRELAECDQQLAQLAQALDDAEQYLLDRNAAAETLERRALDHRREAIDQELERLTRDQAEAARLEELFVRQGELDGQVTAAAEAIAKLHEQLAHLEREMPLLAQRCRDLETAQEEARRALQLAIESQDLALRRAELLQPGRPCPLCGAEEHAWHGAAPLSDFLDNQRLRLAELETSLRAANERLNGARADHKANQRVLEQRQQAAAEQVGRQTAQLRDLQARWPNLFQSGQDPDRQKLTETRRDQEARERRLRADQETARLAHKQAEEARRQARDAAAERDKCLAEREHLRTEQAELARRGADIQTRYTRAADRESKIREQLAPLLAQCPPELAGSPALLRDTLGARVHDWQNHENQRKQLQQDRAERASLLTAAQAAVASARERHHEQVGQRDRLAAELRDWVAKRATLLDGRDTRTLREDLARDRKLAQEALDLARDQVRATTSEQQALQQRLSDQQTHHRELELATAKSQSRLSAECERLGVAEPEVPTLLAHDPSWCDQQRHQLAQARDLLAKWQGLLQERKQGLERHRSTAAPLERVDELPALLEQARAELEQTRETRHRHLAQLAENAERRRRFEALGPAYHEQQQTTDLWQIMSELIGSHDGAKFRKFAQGMTLDLLIQAANGHLRELHPRYALKRLPGEDLEMLVIDLDMAEEERGLAGLSGGETFLVSLALALGLASLNATGHQIESLFIDEGFGALDAQSLDTALDMLDQLQHRGRQVGIISHVTAVAERVACLVRIVPEGNGASLVRV